MKKWWLVIVFALVAFGGVYGGSPYWAANNLKESARTGDADTLEELVDFPAVRESLKSQFNASLMDKMQNDPEMADNPFAGLAMAIAPALIDRTVDAYVTPDGIAAIARGQKPDETVREDPNIEYKSEWASLDKFRVTAEKSDSDEAMPTFVFERRGIVSWKLTKIEFPDDFLGSN